MSLFNVSFFFLQLKMLGQAIDNLKASAAAGTQRGSKPAETKPTKPDISSKSQTSSSGSGLPPNFFESSIKHPGKI